MVKKVPLQIRRISATVCFVILFIVIVIKMSDVFERKYSYSKYYDFYQQKQDFDVLFLGTSHVLNAVYPMELWRDYGIISYNLANHSENICTNYWQLRNALEHTKPKAVVIDLYAVDGDGKVNERYLHNFTDEMPFSFTKIKMVQDLLEPEKRPEYLFNFSLYHSRWEELGLEDLNPSTGLEKGAELRDDIAINQPPTLIPKEEYDPTNRINKQYLQKIIDLCKEQDIAIILMYLPYTMPKDDQLVANWGYAAAKKNKIPYLNFVYEDLALNYATDCADIAHHLNSSGARKVTDYLGMFLTQNYDIPDRRDDPAYAFWQQDYREYREMIHEWINTINNLYSYLVMLNDKDLSVRIYLSENSFIYENPEIMELIENINVYGSVELIKDSGEETTNEAVKIEVSDVKTGNIVGVRMFTRKEVDQTQISSYEDENK